MRFSYLFDQFCFKIGWFNHKKKQKSQVDKLFLKDLKCLVKIKSTLKTFFHKTQ